MHVTRYFHCWLLTSYCQQTEVTINKTFSSVKTVFHLDSLPRGELDSSVSMSGWGGMTCLALQRLGFWVYSRGGKCHHLPLSPNETPEDMSSCTLTINYIPSPQGW